MNTDTTPPDGFKARKLPEKPAFSFPDEVDKAAAANEVPYPNLSDLIRRDASFPASVLAFARQQPECTCGDPGTDHLSGCAVMVWKRQHANANPAQAKLDLDQD